MSGRKIKLFFLTAFVAVFFLATIAVLSNTGSFALGVEIIGDNSGITVKSSESSLDFSGLYPTAEFLEKFSSVVTVGNQGSHGFDLMVRLENKSEAGNILYDNLDMLIASGGTELFKGKIKELKDNRYLVRVAAGEEKELKIYFRLPQGSDNRHQGQKMDFAMAFTAQQVRQYNIVLMANPENGGAVYNGGTYSYGDGVTVRAEASDGFEFLNWTEDGIVVSENADYYFIVENDRLLVANFQPAEEQDDEEDENGESEEGDDSDEGQGNDGGNEGNGENTDYNEDVSGNEETGEKAEGDEQENTVGGEQQEEMEGSGGDDIEEISDEPLPGGSGNITGDEEIDIMDEEIPGGQALPKTGGISPLLYYLTGALLIIGGILLGLLPRKTKCKNM